MLNDGFMVCLVSPNAWFLRQVWNNWMILLPYTDLYCIFLHINPPLTSIKWVVYLGYSCNKYIWHRYGKFIFEMSFLISSKFVYMKWCSFIWEVNLYVITYSNSHFLYAYQLYTSVFVFASGVWRAMNCIVKLYNDFV